VFRFQVSDSRVQGRVQEGTVFYITSQTKNRL